MQTEGVRAEPNNGMKSSRLAFMPAAFSMIQADSSATESIRKDASALTAIEMHPQARLQDDFAWRVKMTPF